MPPDETSLTVHSLDDHDLSSQIDGNDHIAVVGVCSPTGQVPWPIYISTYAWKGDMVDFVIVATTKSTFLARPVADLPSEQYSLTFSTGHAYLDCEDNGESEQLLCEISTYVCT